MYSEEILEQEKNAKVSDELVFFNYEEELRFTHCDVLKEELFYKSMKIYGATW